MSVDESELLNYESFIKEQQDHEAMRTAADAGAKTRQDMRQPASGGSVLTVETIPDPDDGDNMILSIESLHEIADVWVENSRAIVTLAGNIDDFVDYGKLPRTENNEYVVEDLMKWLYSVGEMFPE